MKYYVVGYMGGFLTFACIDAFTLNRTEETVFLAILTMMTWIMVVILHLYGKISRKREFMAEHHSRRHSTLIKKGHQSWIL